MRQILMALSLLLAKAVCGQTERGEDSSFIRKIVETHNAYRSALQLPPLAWSSELAAHAKAWALRLAKEDRGQHDFSIRGREGENLWWGTAGYESVEGMVDRWGKEKEDFVYGTFPDCRKNSSAIVGHYTQIIWRTTQAVGCALAGNGKTEFLVCRYGPPGNTVGLKPY